MRNLLAITTSLLAGLITSSLAAQPPRAHHGPQTLYTMTNANGPNEVMAFDRQPDGSLTYSRSYATGGQGSGGGLGNQGGVVLSDDHRWLLAINAGSNELTAFAVTPQGLRRTDTVASGGKQPVSVTIRRDRVVYVVHAGSDDIHGFWLTPFGRLLSLPGSTRPLSASAAAPAQIGFSRHGRFLLVTEKATNNIRTFVVGHFGYPVYHVDTPSAGRTPFALGFDRGGRVFVSEVFGGEEDKGAVSSYRLQWDGHLEVVDASVPNTETAPCWLVVTPNGRYVYTTNTPDDSLSGYRIDRRGTLELLDANGRTAEPGPGTKPLDMDITADGRFLYTLNSGVGRISGFRVMPDGSLVHLGMTPALLPASANGLAVQ